MTAEREITEYRRIIKEHGYRGRTRVCSCGEAEIPPGWATGANVSAYYRAHLASVLADREATIRADEREQAAGRVESLESFARGDTDRGRAHLMGYVSAQRAAARVVRGDT